MAIKEKTPLRNAINYLKDQGIIVNDYDIVVQLGENIEKGNLSRLINSINPNKDFTKKFEDYYQIDLSRFKSVEVNVASSIRRIEAINEVALPLWKELVFAGEKDDYVFSEGLRPGKMEINPKQITRRWYVHIKQSKKFKEETKLNITADFYAFKHLFLDMIAESNDLKTASKAAGHTNIQTTKNHYTINQKRRELKEMKDLHISLLPINLN